MKFTVYYIDDRAHPVSINASSSELAARQFLALQPRTDTSQITAESAPSRPNSGREISHFRACDLCNTPSPPDDVESEDLALRIDSSTGPDPYRDVIVSGGVETLRTLASRLQQIVGEFAAGPEGQGIKLLYRVPLVQGEGSRFEYSLSFEADPDVSRHWTRGYSPPLSWGDPRRSLIRCVIFILSCVGLWTVGTWIF